MINKLCCLQTAFGNDNVFMTFQKYYRFLNPVSNITPMIYIKNVFVKNISSMFKHNINSIIDMMYYLLSKIDSITIQSSGYNSFPVFRYS